MPIDINKIWIFRIIPIQNLEFNLRDGLYCKNANRADNGFVTISSQDVITRRDTTIVECYPDTVVNDYVPFYFSVRTPMLYNIITGYGVPKFPQEDIIYLCCKLQPMISSGAILMETLQQKSLSFIKICRILKIILTGIQLQLQIFVMIMPMAMKTV